MSSAAAISARGLSYKVGRAVLLQPLDLSLLAGEFVGVLGPSGCGKSTLLRCLSGLTRPSTGQVLLEDRPLLELSPEERRRIGFVPQDDVVHGSLKVEPALTYTGRLLGLTGDALRARVDQVIKLLELDERRKVRTDRLSGGQRKRVSIGVELMAEPPVLFLDEPTAGLDPALVDSFMANCRSVCSGGRTMLMSTHDMLRTDTLDLIIVLQKGHLIYLGPPAQAPQYFGVQTLPEIYKQLSSDPAAAAQRFAASPLHASYVAGRQA